MFSQRAQYHLFDYEVLSFDCCGQPRGVTLRVLPRVNATDCIIVLSNY